MNEIPRKALCEIVKKYGVKVIDDGRRCEALLMDLCPSYRKENRVIIAALNEKIPHNLINSSKLIGVSGILGKLEKRLTDNQAITIEASRWAVETWAKALEILPNPGSETFPQTKSPTVLKPSNQFVQNKTNHTNSNPAKSPKFQKNANRGIDILALFVLAGAVVLFILIIGFANRENLETSSVASSVIFGVASFLFNLVGSTAYLVPGLLAIAAWRIYKSRSLQPSFSRILAFLLLIISVAGLNYIFGGYAGLAGSFIGGNLVWLFGKILSTFFLGIIAFASVLVIPNFSFAFLSENLQMATDNFDVHFDEWQKKRLEDKQSAVEAASAKKNLSREDNKSGNSTNKNIPIKKEGKSKEAKSDVSSMLQEFSGAPEIKSNKKDSFADLNKETASIEIFSDHSTGELAPDLIEQEAIVEPEPIEPPPPQNFDNYVLPGSEFLTAPPPHLEQKEEELLEIAKQLTEKTKEFKVNGRVMHICQGPVVTTYEFKPDPGVKLSKLDNLVDDLETALISDSIRIDRIPGKDFVGIEVPNYKRETIHLREGIESKKFTESSSLLTIALGKKIDGLNYVADLAKMPHLLIAGATGAGKSVAVNSLVVSILYKAKPDEVKFIMFDLRRVELGLYADIPHLATPIITDPKRAAIALKWAVAEMEKRYKYLAGWGVRNIDGFNEEVKKRNANGELDDEGKPYRTLPFIIIIIDELADLMMVSGKEIEKSIVTLAQMARAVGIHLVLATQRPSIDIITGLIKTNFPSRISFRVSSKADSRTIIDANGAERLLGRGDMLFLPPASSQVVRVHGAFVDEKEIHKIVEHVKAQGKPEYDATITKTEEEMDEGGDLPGRTDPLFWDAVRTIATAKKASTSLLQRHLRIGYGRAAAILDAMVREGYISDQDGSSRARPILQKTYDDLQDMEN